MAAYKAQKADTSQLMQENCKRNIHFPLYVLEKPVIEDHKRLFRNKFKIIRPDGTISDFQYIQQNLSHDNIEFLKDKADSNCTTWPGLKIHYGLDTANNNNTFIFLYQPVNLTLSNTSMYYDTFDVAEVHPDTFYTLQPGSTALVPITTGAAEELISTYANLTFLNASGTYTGIMSDNYPKAIIFPFEEIDKVIKHNANAFMAQIMRYVQKENLKADIFEKMKYYYYMILENSEGIVFDCGAVPYDGDWKQHIILSPVVPRAMGAVFSEKGADLGGLCPPNCPKIFLRVDAEVE